MSDPQEFDVDAFLADEQPTPAAFDVDAFLAEPDDSPNLQRSVEQQLAEAPPGGAVTLAGGARVLRSVAAAGVGPEVVPETAQARRLRLATAGPAEQEADEPTLQVLTSAFRQAKSKQGPALARATELGRLFGVPPAQVLPNLEAFERTAAEADFDASKWWKENRLLFEALADKGPLLGQAVVDPHVGPLVAAFKKVEDVTGVPVSKQLKLSMTPALGPIAIVEEQMAAVSNIVQGKPVFGEVTPEEKQAREAKTAQVDSGAAQEIRAKEGFERTTATLAQRYREARAQTSQGYAGFDLMVAENIGADSEFIAEKQAEVQKLRAEGQPLYLGESGVLADVGEAVQGLISSADNMVARAKAGGATAAIVGGAAAAVTLARTGAPSAALRAGVRFGELAGSKGQELGGLYQGFKAEAGSSYLELRDAKTDGGERFSPAEAAGGAVLYGAVASWLENLGTEATVGATAGALKGRVKSLLMRDAGFRGRVAQLGKAWVDGVATEGVTEGLQSAAEQLVQYAAKSLKDERFQKGPVLNAEQVLREAQAGALAGGVLSGAGAGVTFGLETAKASREDVVAPQQVGIISALASNPVAKQAPSEFAELIAKATEETGAAVREFWVEAREVQRLFQEKGQDEGQMALELAEAAGPEAVDAFKAAVAEGGRFPVPIERVLTTWAESEVGKATLAHTTTSETGPTLAQVTDPKRQEEVQQGAQAIAEKMLAEAADEQAFDDALGEMRQQMLDTGLVQPRQANDSVAVIRAWYETAKADNPQLTWKQLLERAGVLSIAKGDNAETGKTKVKAIDAFTDLRNLLDFGGRSKEGLDLEEKAALLFTDSLTNLRNLEAFEAVPLREGEQVAVITTPDAKAINDHPQGGHDVTNSLFRRMAAVVARIDGGAARAGTDFVLRVPSSEALDAAVAQVQAAMPPGMAVQGGLGATYDAARKDAGARIDAARAEGVLPARGATNYRGALEGVDFAAGVEMPSPSLANEHLAAVDAEGKYEGREKFAEKAFMDPKVPGLLNRLGFLHSKPARFTVALDLRGLKDLNRVFGNAMGDRAIQTFGEQLVAQGGTAFAAAHLSGDEYALKSDSQEALVEFIDDLRAELQGIAIAEYGLPNGERVQHFIEFRDGLAEGDYGAADRELNRRKREQQAASKGDDRGTPGARPGGEGQAAVDARAGVGGRAARAFARGSAPNRPFADLGAGQEEASFDPGGNRSGGQAAGGDAGRVADGVLKADPEDLAVAQQIVGKMPNIARKRRLEAFLSYIAGTGPRPEDSLDGSLVAGLTRADQLGVLREFGIDDPLGSFGVEQPRRKKRDPNAKKSGWTDKGMQEKARDAASAMNRARGKGPRTDRLYQGATPVSSHRLSDGRNIIFDTNKDETVVALVDLERTKKIAEDLKKRFRQHLAVEGNWGEVGAKAVSDGVRFLEQGKLDLAEESFQEALWQEGFLVAAEESRLPEEFEDQEPSDWGSKVYPILTALEERKPLAEARQSPDTILLSGDAKQREAMLVALDEFEAATGRLQQDETSMAGARGYFERPPPGAEGVARAMRVFLNKRADVSTVMHESAHGFLEMLGNLAEAEDAGPRTKQQWADVLKWLGVEKRSDIKREHHEKFARGFEAFLLEGKAPKKSLWGVFSRFKTWLTRIYRTVANLDVKLDDNVRRIFERMLATEDEIQRALGRRGKPAFDSAEEAGMTPEEWAEKLADDAEARDFATRDALAAHTRVALAEKERDWKDFVESQRPAAEAEFDARQDAKAKAWLEGRPKDLLDTSVSPAPIVLDRKATQDAVGASAVKRFKTRAQGGVHPDEVAAVTGYATGREMLQAIASMPKRDAWVATRAEQLARESDAGNAQELDELRRQVRDGVQTYTEQRLLREMAELGRRAEPGDDVSPLGRQIALMQLKRAAGLIVEATPVGRLQPGRVLAKERAASKKVKEAMASGDFDASREWTRQQMLHALVHRATLDALRHRESFERLAEEMSGTDSRKRLGKASTVLRDAADVLLSRLGWPVDTEAGIEALADLPAVFEESGGAPGDWFDAVTESGVLDIGDASRLTVAQLRAVDDGLRQIRAEARLRNETMVAEQRADIEATEAELLREASEVLPAKEAPGTGSSDSALDTVLAKASALDGFLLNPADLVRDLTGDNIDSTWWRTIIEPMRAAKHREAELLKRAVLPVTEAIESLPASAKKRLREGVDGHALFPTHTKALQPPRQRHELLVLALNVGNEGNLQRLLDGRGITLEQVAKALDTLSDAELRWVEKVWDAVSELKKDAFDLEERQTGIRPRGVEAKPFALPSGRVLKGGYFPAVYDRRGSTTGERQQEQQVASLMQPGFVRPGTSHGYVKRRAERVTDSAISLDLGNIYRHLAQVAHDVAFREPIQSVGRLILRPAVQQALRERLGDAKARSFRRWLQDVGGNAGAEVTAGDSLVSWARGAGAHVLLGWSASTALGDFANLATAVAGTPLKAKHLAAGLADFARAPVAARKAALEASPWLRTMVDNTRREFDRQLKTMLDRQLPKPLQWYKDNAFFFMEQVAVATTTPVWLGAHRQALQEGRTQDEAVRFADDVLSQVFPSHHPVDQAAILRDRAFWGRATIFYGYLSTAYRQQHRIIAPLFEQEFLDAGAGGKALTAAKVAGGLLGFWTAFSVLGELLMGRGPEAGDDDEEDPSPLTRWRNWYLRKLVAGPLSTQPFLPLSTAWEAAMTGKIAPSPRSGPLASIIAMIGKDFLAALDGEKAPLERVTAAAKVGVQALGLPLKPFTAQGSFLLDVATGGEVGGPGGAASGLIYGRRPNQPANIFQPGLE